ncbi:MAG: DNA ligase D [Rhodomicrobiaceae bacterium]
MVSVKTKGRAKADTLLAEYKRKRDFTRTREPGEEVSGASGGRRFVVQKHAARSLHYDFRLELDGVLKSWAVTKGPSLDPSEKRLAVRTEDHPLAYADFEGTIPKGEYGGGTVMLWDEGTWEPLHDPHQGLEEGKLHFRLYGKRMTGGWALVRMKPRAGEKRENWLLIKERDETADESDPLLERNEDSVRTGREMEEIAEGDPPLRQRADDPVNSGALPKAPAFQLATLVSEAPEGDDWLHEIKFDGYRCAVAVARGKVKCFSRKGLDWTDRFKRIAVAATKIGTRSALIDGEVAAFSHERTDFSALQAALKTDGDLVYFAFDLLELDGRDLRGRPLVERKAKLKELLSSLPKTSPIHYSDHVRGSGGEVLKRLCAKGQEGVVSKRADSKYVGQRTRSWLKIKCTRRQEFVIVGWTPSTKRGRSFASLLLGYYSGDALIYSGRVGTGFDGATLDELGAKLKALARETSPAEGVPSQIRRHVRWVKPELVAEIAFTEFTADGALRHPSFLGLREDKEADDVVREMPQDRPASANGGSREEVAGIRLSNPDRVLYRDQGLTKSDLAAYYEIAADRMLPHIADRPLSLVRCPVGPTGSCFFQKHDQGGFPNAMKAMRITEASGKNESYYYLDSLAGLIAGVQMAVLEFHIWGCRRDEVEKPDRLVFDLDPDVGLDFSEVGQAALDVRDRLAGLGLKSWPLLTGGKGIHVVAPLERRRGWDDIKTFARGFAAKMAEDEPARFTAKASKAGRKGRMFVDWLRNERGSTAISPYSTRAREGAPVAMPVSWDELEGVRAASIYTVANAAERLRDSRDPWADMDKVTQSLTNAMIEKVT